MEVITKKRKKMVVGIDQSYNISGVAISVNGKCVAAQTVDMKKEHYRFNDKIFVNRSTMRMALIKTLQRIVNKYRMEYEITFIVERIRVFSGSKADNSHHMSPNYLVDTGALIGAIVDFAFDNQIPVFTVDTRSWKSKVVGTSKPGTRVNRNGKTVKDPKGPTLEWVNAQIGKKVSPKINDGEQITDDNMADAICISLYGFIPETDQKLEECTI